MGRPPDDSPGWRDFTMRAKRYLRFASVYQPFESLTDFERTSLLPPQG